MYNLLIVDDEQIITDGLFEVFVGCDRLDLNVFKAYSAFEALEIFYSIKIDVLLLDIRMPEVSGMQLMDVVLRDWPHCRIVFLTGYNEFDYVYNAIRNKGVKYLLKTEGYDKIIETIEETFHDLDESLKIANFSEKAEKYFDMTIRLQQNIYLSSLLDGENLHSDIENSIFMQLGINLDTKGPVLIVVGVIDDTLRHKMYNEKIQCFYSVDIIAEQYWNHRVTKTFVIHKNSYMVWLIQPRVCMNNENEARINSVWEYFISFIKGSIENIQASCRESLKLSSSFAISSKAVDWEEIPLAYIMLRYALSKKYGTGKEMLLTDRYFKSGKIGSECGQNLDWQRILLKACAKLDELDNYLEHGMINEIYNLLNDLTEPIKLTSDMDLNPARELYFTISTRILSYINRYNLSKKLKSKVDVRALTDVNDMETWNNAVDYLKVVIKSIIDEQSVKQKKRTDEIVNLIKEYICENLNKDISLIRLAELVFFNPSYLSRLFKQVTNLNISEFISNARISKAKELLRDTNMKINDIAEMMGYDTASNFSRFFKKHTKLSPQDYRNTFFEPVQHSENKVKT